MALRKNQRTLIAGEKKYFTDALGLLKADGTYDKYVQWHKDTVDDATKREDAHKGPAFLAWHREFLRRFELELQRVTYNPTLGLPYWDWTVDNSPTSSIWGNDFMGGNGKQSDDWAVKDGPFAKGKWELRVRDTVDEPTYLRRTFEVVAKWLPTQADVQAALSATPFDEAPWNDHSQKGFRNRAEGYIPQSDPNVTIPQMHNRVHRWVGGSMIPITSPNDPVFWLHHCFMDKLWADWQALHKDQYAYLPDGGARKGHNLTDPMPPWNDKRPLDLLNTWDLGYHYDTDDYLMANDWLCAGQSISSASRRFSLSFSPPDNDLALTSANWGWPLWRSTGKKLVSYWCIMQGDGNLEIRDWGNNSVWASNTGDNPKGYLKVEDATENRNGHLQMYKWDDETPINWSVPPPEVGNPPKG